jgi:alkaline phosphatase D
MGKAAINRRQFMAAAAALGATPLWAKSKGARSGVLSNERRDLFPEGVASGDPQPDSVILWTRRPFDGGTRESRLLIELSGDESFQQVLASATAPVSAAADWTCRALVGNLKPATVYWYRFTDELGMTSRVGRTLTAPAENDPRPVKFAFVSCQNANFGSQHAYRRMIFEDERAPEAERLGFVLHLGDFIYEIVWYPEDSPLGLYGRKVRDIVHYPHGEKIQAFHIPTTVDDYRGIYRAYLHDPDLQDARARWPFVPMWDNHEFSWLGWQSLQVFDGTTRPAQTRKVAAMQAFFEYQPARLRKSSGPNLDRFDPPHVVNAAIVEFDAHGLGQEPNNLTALASLTGYRALRWGRHVELIITDQRSYRSEDPSGRFEAQDLVTTDFPELFPQEALEILDAGRLYNGMKPPDFIRYGERQIPNFRKQEPPQTILGAEQKAWFLNRLKTSTATWKVWGNTTGTLDFRVDPKNIPAGLTKPWPGSGYAGFRAGDHSTAYVERAEIYQFVRGEGITGFATIAGDRHSFWAGLAAENLPPKAFDPIGIAYIVGSISAPGLVEAMEHKLPREHPLRALYLSQPPGRDKLEPTLNMLLRHGVRSALEYDRTGDIERARGLSNPDLAPHLSFLDLGGHGYATVRASADAWECEFVCIPRPIERITRHDGGPLLYRVVHRTPLWNKGERPQLEQKVLEGNPALSL